MKFFFLLILTSCALIEEDRRIVKSIAQTWKGNPLSALEEHSYFKTLHFKDTEDSPEVFKRTYYRRSKFVGGGVYRASGDCYHVFRIKRKIVDQYRQQGNCREDNQLIDRLFGCFTNDKCESKNYENTGG